MVDMKLNKKVANFEIDMGRSLTVVNEKTWKQTELPSLRPIKTKLETYTGDPVKVIGATFVQVRYKQQCRKLPLVVVKGDGPCLLGRGWLEEISLDWREIKRRHRARKVHQVKTTENTLQRVNMKMSSKMSWAPSTAQKLPFMCNRMQPHASSVHGLLPLPCGQKSTKK